MIPIDTIEAFDKFLDEQGISFECVVVGGAALGLLGIISRHTKDVDVLDPELPQNIVELSIRFAEKRRSEGEILVENWLNNGPASLKRDLSEGWKDRLQLAFSGTALKIHTLGRLDLLSSKLFALCDRGIDIPDCVALAPTDDEIKEIQPWVEQRDAHPHWPDHVRATLEDLREKLKDGI